LLQIEQGRVNVVDTVLLQFEGQHADILSLRVPKTGGFVIQTRTQHNEFEYLPVIIMYSTVWSL
jgi:hypothetical protein